MDIVDLITRWIFSQGSEEASIVFSSSWENSDFSKSEVGDCAVILIAIRDFIDSGAIASSVKYELKEYASDLESHILEHGEIENILAI